LRHPCFVAELADEGCLSLLFRAGLHYSRILLDAPPAAGAF